MAAAGVRDPKVCAAERADRILAAVKHTKGPFGLPEFAPFCKHRPVRRRERVFEQGRIVRMRVHGAEPCGWSTQLERQRRIGAQRVGRDVKRRRR